VTDWLQGTWELVAWRRIAANGAISYPLGADARGQLIYTSNGRMAVQITAASRSPLAADDLLGGDVAGQARAYSTYLAYFGTYSLNGEHIVHCLDGSLFPNWNGEKQVRAVTSEGANLILRTPPVQLADGSTVVNELMWSPAGRHRGGHRLRNLR
jgi:hypothetical protein